LDDDRSLVHKILAGNAGSFRQLVVDHRLLVTRIVYRMVLDRTERDDLCQEVFMRVYANLAHFRFESKLATWIARIAYNTCLNHLQNKHELLAADLLPGEKTLDDLPSPNSSPDTDVESKDLAERLRTEIKALPVHYRTALTLYHLQEMTYGEIASIMGLAEGTVKSHLFRGRRHLKDRLLSRYDEEDLRP
jgi:RNA polymerase sigma factor (sigma-70 family)